MPHFHIEYSANLETTVAFSARCNVIRLAALETDVFPLAGVRVRAMPCPHYSIADGSPQHGFLDISIRLRAGRPETAKKTATAAIFDAAENFIAPVMQVQPIALSLEMRDIDPDLSPKTGTIRKFLTSEAP